MKETKKIQSDQPSHTQNDADFNTFSEKICRPLYFYRDRKKLLKDKEEIQEYNIDKEAMNKAYSALQ